MIDRRDQVAIVTGGSQGIGLATAAALAGRGMIVVAAARDEVRLAAAAETLAGRVVPRRVDVRDEASVAALVAGTVDRFGRLDLLVNAAGVSMTAKRRLADTTGPEWERLVSTNLTGTYLMCRQALGPLARAPNGMIVNIQSTASYHAGAGASLYAATKYGVRALGEALAEECRGTSIRVSAVSPGPVDTTIWSHKLEPPSDDERARMLRPDDIARIVLWLAEQPGHVHVPNITVTPWTGP